MKPCFSKRKLIAWLALGELDERRAQQLRSHIQTCEGCRRYTEELSALREKLAPAERNPELEASEGFHRKWVSRLEAEASPSAWQIVAQRLNWRVALPALGTAVVVVVVLLLSLFPRQPAASPPAEARRAEATPPVTARDLSPTVANYQRAAVRSLDEFDELLTEQANRNPAPAPTYTASIFAVATLPN